jgi:hypothetical protein
MLFLFLLHRSSFILHRYVFRVLVPTAACKAVALKGVGWPGERFDSSGAHWVGLIGLGWSSGG